MRRLLLLLPLFSCARPAPVALRPGALVASGQAEPVALAAQGGFVYWVNHGDRGQRGVVRAPLAGGPAQVVAPESPEAWGLALDAGAAYFIEYGRKGALWRAPLDGSPEVRLAEGRAFPTALALQGGFLYWLDFDAPGTLARVPVHGGRIDAVATGLGHPGALLLDGDGALVADWDGRVVRVPFDGGAQHVERALPFYERAGLLLPGGWLATVRWGGAGVLWRGAARVAALPAEAASLAASARYVYWTTSGGVFRAPLAGGPAEPFASTAKAGAVLAVDGRVFFTDPARGEVRVAPE